MDDELIAFIFVLGLIEVLVQELVGGRLRIWGCRHHVLSKTGACGIAAHTILLAGLDLGWNGDCDDGIEGKARKDEKGREQHLEKVVDREQR